MHLSTSLRTILERALLTALGAPVVLSACGPLPLSRDFVAPACSGNGSLSVDGLTPAVPVDFINLRTLSSDRGGNVYDKATSVSSLGTACATATNKAMCESKLASVNLTAGFAENCLQICNAAAVVATRGDDILELTNLTAWKAFLGTIDTPQEAALTVYAAGYEISCTDTEQGAVRKTSKGFEVVGMKGYACGPNTARKRYTVAVTPDGTLSEVNVEVVKVGDPNCAVGRRPEGLQAAAMPMPGSALGQFFSEVAFLEAASVSAFDRMARELAAVGAPVELQHRARLARHDEVRHARVTAKLARRFGGAVVTPHVTELPLRSIADMAHENAVEGCVRETFGALVAQHQARKATDREIAEQLQRIAADELKHAELSWAVHAHLNPQLSAVEQQHIELAQRNAIENLRAELQASPDASVVETAGMPDAKTALTLLDQLETTLWLS